MDFKGGIPDDTREFTFTGTGERAIVKTDTTPSYFAYDGSKLLEQRDTAGAAVFTYRHNDSFLDSMGSILEIEQAAGSLLFFPGFDQNGSTVTFVEDGGVFGPYESAYDFFGSVIFSDNESDQQARAFSPLMVDLDLGNTQIMASVPGGSLLLTPLAIMLPGRLGRISFQEDLGLGKARRESAACGQSKFFQPRVFGLGNASQPPLAAALSIRDAASRLGAEYRRLYASVSCESPCAKSWRYRLPPAKLGSPLKNAIADGLRLGISRVITPFFGAVPTTLMTLGIVNRSTGLPSFFKFPGPQVSKWGSGYRSVMGLQGNIEIMCRSGAGRDAPPPSTGLLAQMQALSDLVKLFGGDEARGLPGKVRLSLEAVDLVLGSGVSVETRGGTVVFPIPVNPGGQRKTDEATRKHKAAEAAKRKAEREAEREAERKASARRARAR